MRGAVRRSVDMWLRQLMEQQVWLAQQVQCAVPPVPPFPQLMHRLSAHVPASIALVAPRTPAERCALQACRRGFVLLRRRPALANLLALMTDISARVGGSTTGLRTCTLATVRDAGGAFTLFPPAHSVRPQLAELMRCLQPSICSQPALAALTALVGIQVIHPFIDGNGRVARVVFHGLLGVHPQAYVPLYELAAVSRGAYLLSLREASYWCDWAPITDHVATASRLAWQGLPCWPP